MPAYSITITKGLDTTTGIMTFNYNIPQALLDALGGKVYKTIVNRVVGNQGFLLANTEYTLIWLNGEASNYAYRGKMKMYFAVNYRYVVHRYQRVNGAWREFEPQLIDATNAAKTDEFTWEDTESFRISVECNNVLGSVDYEYGYDRKEE